VRRAIVVSSPRAAWLATRKVAKRLQRVNPNDRALIVVEPALENRGSRTLLCGAGQHQPRQQLRDVPADLLIRRGRQRAEKLSAKGLQRRCIAARRLF